jgi:uncharacterized protein (TIGR03437 family)
VRYKGVPSNGFDLQVVDTMPGIFPNAIVNQDLSLNSPQNGAEPGSIITFYSTGEGRTNPESVTGQITGSVLNRPIRKVSVVIGGQPADVLYAGAAPGQVAGVMQVNVRVPEGVLRGIGASLVFTVGDASGPAGSIVSIRP